MITDDDEDLRILVAVHLRKCGYNWLSLVTEMAYSTTWAVSCCAIRGRSWLTVMSKHSASQATLSNCSRHLFT